MVTINVFTMQQKAKQKIKHIKMLQQIFTRMYPPVFFSLQLEGGCFTDRHTNTKALLFTMTTPTSELKVTALFFWRGGGGRFINQHLLYTVLNFFSVIFLDNVSIPIVLELCVWIEPLFGGLFRRSQVLCTLYGEHFKLIFFPQRQSSKAVFLSVRQMRLAEILERKGWAGLPARSC